MDSTLAWAILQTLCYAAVFSYPLTSVELGRYLISKKRYTHKEISGTLRALVQAKIVTRSKDQRWHILKDVGSPNTRLIRAQTSRRKLRKVMPAIRLLSRLPTVELIGISGAVARRNANKQDDVDLFIITSCGSLWWTRLIAILVTERLGIRRRVTEKRVANKLCLNMFVDSKHLAIPFSERDLFSAYEVVQMRPIFVRGNIYAKFLWQNRWVREFLGNRRINPSTPLGAGNYEYFLLPLELLAKTFQLWYMRRRRTTEYIADGYLRFHPQDARKWILGRYRWRRAQVHRQFKQIKTNRVSHQRLFVDS